MTQLTKQSDKNHMAHHSAGSDLHIKESSEASRHSELNIYSISRLYFLLGFSGSAGLARSTKPEL